MKFFLTIFYVFIFCCSNGQADSIARSAKPIVHKNIQKPKIVDSLKAKNTFSFQDSSNFNFVFDTTKSKDTSSLLKDTVVKILERKDSNTYSILIEYPILNSNKTELMITAFKDSSSKDILFYALLCIVIVLAIVKLIFPRYVKNIFAIIFQTQFRQVQTREQLSQDNVASMLLNILFIISTSFFIALALENIGFVKYSFWYVALVACIALICIYLFKLLFTQFLGWIYNKSTAATAYNFIVFIINKILGIVFIPILFLIAFSNKLMAHQVIEVSLAIIAILLFFRLFITYKSVSNILKINAFHFFLYFCCVEILPLLIMFKFLNHYISNGI